MKMPKYEVGKLYHLKYRIPAGIRGISSRIERREMLGEFYSKDARPHYNRFLPLAFSAKMMNLIVNNSLLRGHLLRPYYAKEIPKEDLPLFCWMPSKTRLFAQYISGSSTLTLS